MRSSDPIDFERILRLFAEAQADVVVIGGLAANILGAENLTFDVGFAFSRSRANARIIAGLLAPFHPRPLGFDPNRPYVWDEQTVQGMTTMTLETDIGRIDFLAEPDGTANYARPKNNAVRFELGDRDILVASIDDLIAMKKAASREKNLGHLQTLEALRKLAEEES